jgi:MFS family permease
MRFWMLASAAGFMFGNFYFYDQTSATEDAVRDQTGMSEDDFGLLQSVYSWPNVILPLFGGLVIDFVGCRAACILFTVLIFAGSSLFTVGLSLKSSWLLVAARVIFGMGGESQNVASLAIIAKWFRGKELAFAVAVDIAVSRLGSVSTFGTQGALTTALGVTAASAIGSCICLISLVSAVVCVTIDWWSDRKDAERGLVVHRASADEVVRLKDITQFSSAYWLVTVSCVTTYVASIPFMQVISAPFLKDRLNFDTTAADPIAMTINLTPAFLAPILGIIVDRYGYRPILLTASSTLYLITFIGFLVYPQCDHCWSILSLYVLIGIALSVYGSVIWPCVPLVVPENITGTAFGLMTALQNSGMAVSPLVITKMHNATGEFTGPFLYIIACVAIGLVAGISIWVIDHRGDQQLMKGTLTQSRDPDLSASQFQA